MAYPTRAQLVSASTVAELTTLVTADQDALYQSAISAVESYCGQSFATAANGTEILDGKGGKRVYLPKRLSSITALTATGTAFASTDVQLSSKKDYLTLTPTAGISTYYLRALNDVMDFDPRRAWPIGENMIMVTGNWGWTDSEYTNQLGAITLALRWDMEDMARSGAAAGYGALAAYKALGASKVRQDTLEVWFDTARNTMGLSSRVTKLLEPFIWLGDMGQVV